jgi:hypothetical protein
MLMDKEERPVKEEGESAEVSVGKEKSLKGFTKEEPINLEPNEIIETEKEN